jgi:O-antigen/teichoic acid export membrane protein
LTILIAQATTKTEAGVFFSATSLFVLITAAGQLGTDNGLVYFFARVRSGATSAHFVDYLRTATWPVMVGALCAATALFLFAVDIASIVSPDQPELCADSLRALALFIPFAGLEAVSLSASRGLGTMRPNVIVEQLLRPGLQLLCAAAILFGNLRLELAWSWAVPYAVAGLAALLWLRRLIRREPSRYAKVKVGKEFWLFSAPRSLAGVAQLAMQRLDIVLVGALAGAADAAVYAAATRFIVLGQLARNAVSMAVQPQLALALSGASRVVVERLYRVSTSWLMAVAWPVYIALIVDGSLFLGVFGHGYVVATNILVMLSLSMLVATLCGDVDIMLIMSGRTVWSMINLSAALALNLGLDLWLIPARGIEGAAIGWSVAIIAKNVIAFVEVAFVFRMHPIGRETIIVGACSAFSFAAVVSTVQLLLGAGTVTAVIAMLCGTASYGLLIWIFREGLGVRALMSDSLARLHRNAAR